MKRREGRRDGAEEQTDAAQTPEGLRSHIFLASSLGDTDMWGERRRESRAHKRTAVCVDGRKMGEKKKKKKGRRRAQADSNRWL